MPGHNAICPLKCDGFRELYGQHLLYDVYASCMPGSQATYLVLSLIFPVTRPIFLMSCRKKGLQYP